MKDNPHQRIRDLLATAESAELGPGPRPGVGSERELETKLGSCLGDAALAPPAGELTRALILLWHDHLDAAHTISQSIENVDGSLVHAIMHRREPDYWNSKYWWRRVGRHPCFEAIAGTVGALLRERGEAELQNRLVPRGTWDPFAFVDACEAAAKAGQASTRSQLLREVQRREFEAVLDHFLGAP